MEVFKILNGHENINRNSREHDFTLVGWMLESILSPRTTNHWNNLPGDCVLPCLQPYELLLGWQSC